ASAPRDAVKRTTPALAAAYSGAPCGPAPRPATDATLTIAPPRRRRSGSRASCVASIAARRFTSSTRCQCSTGALGYTGGSTPPAVVKGRLARRGGPAVGVWVMAGPRGSRRALLGEAAGGRGRPVGGRGRRPPRDAAPRGRVAAGARGGVPPGARGRGRGA